MPRLPPDEQHPALLLHRQQIQQEDAVLEEVPGWGRFSQSQKQFLRLISWYGGNATATSRAIGKNPKWYEQLRRKDLEFQSAAEERRTDGLDIYRALRADLLNLAAGVFIEALEKGDDGKYKMGDSRAMDAAKFVIQQAEPEKEKTAGPTYIAVSDGGRLDLGK